MGAAKNTIVYLVTGTPPNDRVRKVAQLREHFDELFLVRREPGRANDYEPTLVVRPIRNPVGLLRLAGLRGVAAKLDRLYFPNTAILYARALERRLSGMISKDLAAAKEVCVITCAPPHAVCMAGLRLKKRFPQIKWVVDWQDLWSYDDNYFLAAPGFHRPRIREVEAEILRNADVNITTNTHAKRVLEEKYAANRVVAIQHHFNRADLNGRSDISPRDTRPGRPITIGFLGTLFKPPRVPGGLMVDTIRKLRRSGIDVELHVHGGVNPALKLDAEALRQDGIHLHGYTTHATGIALLGQYDYLLVLLADLPNSEAVMSIKLPHYLLTERPILAVVPDRSAVAQIVRETGTGVVIPSGSDWAGPLKNVLEARDGNGLPVRNEAAIERFSWTRISTEWLDVICAREGRAASENGVSAV